MDPHAHERLWDRADPLAIRLLAAVRPLFRGRGHRPPEHIGTAVLVRVGPARLMLTAAHVVDEFLGPDMLLSGIGSLDGIKAKGVRRELPAGKSRDDDPIDIGILRIDDDCLLSVDRDFLTPAAIGIEEPFDLNNTYLALGYPLSKTRINRAIHRVEPHPVKYVGAPSELTVYQELALHPSTHVAIEFDRDQTVTDTGIRQVANPKGMSGGGVWWWRNARDRYGIPDARLTAILTAHRKRQKVLVATRVRYHIATIRRQWPDLSPYLEGFPTP